MKLTPDELKAAYVRATLGASGPHPAAELLSRLLAGEVTEEERRGAVAHVAVCARCAEEVRVAGILGDGLAGGAAARVVRPAVWRRPALLATAAVVLVAGGLALVLPRSTVQPQTAFRAVEGAGVRSLLPPGARLRRDAFVLRWAPAPASATFEVVVANERLDVVANVKGIRSAEATIPPGDLREIPSGSKLVWQVTTIRPDGSRDASPSFLVTLE